MSQRPLPPSRCPRLLRLAALALLTLGATAASAAAQTFEAEGLGSTITPATTLDQSYTDQDASNKRALVLWSNSSIVATTTEGISTVTFRLRGDQCNGAPTLQTIVDSVSVGTPIAVPATTWTDYTVKLPTPKLAGSPHTVKIAYNNNAVSGCDRNLRIDSITTTPKLKWPAPTLAASRVQLHLGTAFETFMPGGAGLRLNPQTDYELFLPNAPRERLLIVGGHNVVIRGGWIRPTEPNQKYAIWITQNTGTVHLEGLNIDNTLAPNGDGIDITSPLSTVQVQNVRISGISGSQAGTHGDLIQPYGGVDTLRVDRLTGRTGYQGLFLRPDEQRIGNVDLSNIDMEYTRNSVNEGGVMLWLTTDCLTDKAANKVDPAAVCVTNTGQQLTDRCMTAASVAIQNVYVGTVRLGSPALAFGEGNIFPKTTSPTWNCPAQLSGSTASWPALANRSFQKVTGSVTDGVPAAGPYVADTFTGLGYMPPS